MSFPSPSLQTQQLPDIRVPPPGPASQAQLAAFSRVSAPMGPRSRGEPESRIVYESAGGANVRDVDGNLYVDLAGGFGSLLLGHGHPFVQAALIDQSQRLMQALGDVYPASPKLALLQRLTELYPSPARAWLTQSGSDAVSAALKTAVLATGRARVIAFEGAYHGLGYGPLAACGLRASYRAPFAEQLNPHVSFLPYPAQPAELPQILDRLQRELRREPVGAILIEPILGRGGVIVPPTGFLREVASLAKDHGALWIADEVWTGLGRSGHWLYSLGSEGARPDLICLGKGLGGGLPISAVVGREEVMVEWSREAEVMHTSTFAGAPLACATALATLDVLEQEGLISRAQQVGEALRGRLSRLSGISCRGAGLMLALEAKTPAKAWGVQLQRRLLARGYITSTGGGSRDVLVLTPPLNISEALLDHFAEQLEACGGELGT